MDALARLLDDMLKAGWDIKPTSHHSICARSPDNRKVLSLSQTTSHRRGLEVARREFTSWMRSVGKDKERGQEAINRITNVIHKEELAPKPRQKRKKEPPMDTPPVKYQPGKEPEALTRPVPQPPPSQRSKPIPPEEQLSAQNGHQKEDSLGAIKDDLLAVASLVEKELKAIAYRIELMEQKLGDDKDFKAKLRELLT